MHPENQKILDAVKALRVEHPMYQMRAEEAERELAELRSQKFKILDFDDGGYVEFAGFSSEKSPEGAWGTIMLVFVDSFGTKRIREYRGGMLKPIENVLRNAD